MSKELEKALKKMVAEGLKLKKHHNPGNKSWKDAIDNAEEVLHKVKNQDPAKKSKDYIQGAKDYCNSPATIDVFIKNCK
jgi:hypothetical protein